jgi:hypothetical protein
MPLITGPDGSNTFVMPQNQGIGMDIENLVAPRVRLPSSREIGQSTFEHADLMTDLGDKAWAGAHYFRWTLSERRGMWKQSGYFDDPLDMISYADTTHLFEAREVGIHTSKVGAVDNVVFNAHFGSRLTSAHFKNTMVLGAMEFNVGQTTLLKATGAYNPVFSAVAGYSPPLNATNRVCMEQVRAFGQSYLLIGFAGAPAAGGIQVLQDLNNPPTSSAFPGFALDSIWGICQTPIDGDSLQIYATSGVYMYNTDLGILSGTLQARNKLPSGGYTVGLVSINPNTEVWYCVPENDLSLFAPPSVDANYFPMGPLLFRGKLVRMDLRAFTVQEVATSTTFVLWATSGRFGVFYCDGTSHFYMTRGADIPVAPADDRPVTNANVVRQCCGHWHNDDKFYWEENSYDASDTLVTRIQRFCYDIYQNRAYPVSREMVSTRKKVVSMGAPKLPWHVESNNMVGFMGNEWVYQYMPPTGQRLYSRRHTDGAAATSSREYEYSATTTTPAMTHSKFPRALYRVHRIIGPPRANLRTGSGTETGEDFRLTGVYVDVSKTPQAVFNGGVENEGRSQHHFVDQDSWTPELQAVVRSIRDTFGANSSHRTPNPWPITIEGIFVQDGFKLPSIDSIKELVGVLESTD